MSGQVTRKIKQGPVQVDFEESALVVNYEVETVEVDDKGAVLEVLDRKPEMRRIKIKALSPDKNMAQLAADIVDKCKYIHPSRVEEIEQLLIRLRKHHMTAGAQSSAAASVPTSQQDDEPDRRRGGGNSKGRGENDDSENNRNRERERAPPKPKSDNLPPADMSELDDYLEMLYQVSGKTGREREESLRLQERGTAMILKLCRNVMNLEQLIQNSTVMGALTRVLQEEFKKSIDLTFNIVRIFLAFSNFAEMHSLMANYRIGVLTMKAIEFEVKRTELRDAERQEREKEFADELARAKESPSEYLGVTERIKKTREKEAQKQKIFVRKQDKLLFVSFYVLLNLAEDVNVERKMIKKNLIQMLLSMLHRNFEDLLILCVTFLKKLSMFEENKEIFKELNMVDVMSRFLSCSSQPLITIGLRFLFNLSFDKDMREQMLRSGYIPKLVQLLKTPSYRAKTLKLLYHLSVDDRCKSMVTYTEGVGILMGMIINFPQDFLAKELAALMINLSYNARICESMIANRGLNLLMDRFADKRDPLLMKIIRNISLWTFNQQQEQESPELSYKFRGLWSPHIKILVEIMLEEDNHDLIVEILGCLANMTVYDLPATSNWSKLLREYNLINYFSKFLVPGMAQNDVVLEIVILIGSIATDAPACSILAQGNLIPTLYQLMKDKTDDTEILLQSLNCFDKLLYTQASREVVMYNTRIFADIIESLTHRSAAVRAMAEKMSEFVLEHDRKPDGSVGQLGKQVIKRRFESYNKVWLANTQYEMSGSGGMMGYDDNGSDRLMSAQEQEYGMMSSMEYLNDKVQNSMMGGQDWRGDGKYGGTMSAGSYQHDVDDSDELSPMRGRGPGSFDEGDDRGWSSAGGGYGRK
jgi:hypothetical protein